MSGRACSPMWAAQTSSRQVSSQASIDRKRRSRSRIAISLPRYDLDIPCKDALPMIAQHRGLTAYPYPASPAELVRRSALGLQPPNILGIDVGSIDTDRNAR